MYGKNAQIVIHVIFTCLFFIGIAICIYIIPNDVFLGWFVSVVEPLYFVPSYRDFKEHLKTESNLNLYLCLSFFCDSIVTEVSVVV